MSNNTTLLKSLRKIKRDGFPGRVEEKFRWCPEITSDTKLECLFFRITNLGMQIDSLHEGFKILTFIGPFIDSCSSIFLQGVCKYYYSNICQQLVQKMSISKFNKQIKLSMFHKLLQEGLKTDAVSGWLLYASFYYVLGRYKTTLCIVDYILSRCTPGMFLLTIGYSEFDEILYQSQICKHLTLGEKMKIGTIDCVIYNSGSCLIPEELRLYVMDDELMVLPDVMSHCLRFLCYHHLHEISMRNEALCDLQKSAESVIPGTLDHAISPSFTISGVCNAIAGRKQCAFNCYKNALDCRGVRCKGAGRGLIDLVLNKFTNLTND
ncbi:unnamed protein product [Mytilus coruscus]|uniref:Uncharacterized protein n=1 Tax=Mytilus coruscus TaxID=42192 RepID=A0A6J8B8H2_MYTCO|nr:unnamed protein product [Mytilus coruscus]